MSQNTIIYIAAGSGAGLLLIILIVVLCCCCRRKRTQPEYPSQFDNNVAMKNMNGASAGPYGPSGSERTMLNQNAAPMGMGPPPPMSPGGPGGAKDMYTAVYDYAPAQSDELEAFVGDKIIIKTEFDDGWAFGFNTRSRKEGHFPLDILDKYAQQNQAFGQNGGPSVYSKRASSMYGPQGGQQSVYGTDSMYAPGQQSMYGTASVYAPGQESMYVDNGKVHKVVYDFNPEQKDEAELRVGDSIQLKQEYDDGWGHGLNLTTGQTGLFPLDCLEGFENQEFDDQGQKKNKLRASSIYGGGQDSVYYGNAGNTQSVYSEYAPGTDSVYYNAPQGGRR
ncbi:hypothetical protein BC830DRAFT_964559 [Chytriomyces sp. MP71]|nr:hypothetical protein BC830DRAFT_964559 [Chytriomyces sp. MP71]